MDYKSFLQSKIIEDLATGFECEPSVLNSNAFEWQRPCIQWMLRRGRGALFQAPGLGKSIQQLIIAHEIIRKTNGKYLIFAPLAVAHQTVREAAKFGIPDVKYVRAGSECDKPGIWITNYEMMKHFDPREFIGVGCDESSIMKSKEGHYKTTLCEDWTAIPYRHCYTATPSPNDYAELGNHSEFLGVMSRSEMEATFFFHDGGETSKWTLMPHAQEAFWKWVASWALLMRTPSDIGFSDDGYQLPGLNVREHVLQSQGATDGYLIPMPATDLMSQRRVKRDSLADRCEKVREIVCENDDFHVVWTELNDEGDALEKMIPDAVQIAGKDSMEEKERKILGFLNGDYRRQISKPSITGFGLNYQFCNQSSTVNLTHSAEDMYQYLRRFYRFGQKREVNANLVLTEAEMPILINVNRKQKESDFMSEKVVHYMKDSMIKNITGSVRHRDNFNPTQEMILPSWLK